MLGDLKNVVEKHSEFLNLMEIPCRRLIRVSGWRVVSGLSARPVASSSVTRAVARVPRRSAGTSDGFQVVVDIAIVE